VVYYLPNYFLLEKLIADHTASFLNAFGLQVQTRVIGEHVFLADIEIVKDCTGVQVIAVFLGIIIPIPKATVKKKLLALTVISISLYVANLLRIALEFSLVYLIFYLGPWRTIHSASCWGLSGCSFLS